MDKEVILLAQRLRLMVQYVRLLTRNSPRSRHPRLRVLKSLVEINKKPKKVQSKLKSLLDEPEFTGEDDEHADILETAPW